MGFINQLITGGPHIVGIKGLHELRPKIFSGFQCFQLPKVDVWGFSAAWGLVFWPIFFCHGGLSRVQNLQPESKASQCGPKNDRLRGSSREITDGSKDQRSFRSCAISAKGHGFASKLCGKHKNWWYIIILPIKEKCNVGVSPIRKKNVMMDICLCQQHLPKPIPTPCGWKIENPKTALYIEKDMKTHFFCWLVRRKVHRKAMLPFSSPFRVCCIFIRPLTLKNIHLHENLRAVHHNILARKMLDPKSCDNVSLQILCPGSGPENLLLDAVLILWDGGFELATQAKDIRCESNR